MFKWSDKSELAAQLCGEGKLRYTTIADRVGVTYQGLWLWRKEPEFAERVKAIAQDIDAAIFRRAISRREQRIDSLNARWVKLNDVIDARAEDPDHAKAPGGDTGLLVRNLKRLGTGDDAETVEEFAVDTGLLKALLDVEKQAAIELGQWTEKHEVGSDPDKPFVFKVLKNVSMDDI